MRPLLRGFQGFDIGVLCAGRGLAGCVSWIGSPYELLRTKTPIKDDSLEQETSLQKCLFGALLVRVADADVAATNIS